MKTTVNRTDFHNAFNQSVYKENFSYEALNILFDYFESYEQETGEEIELDVIAICCDYEEWSEAEIREAYEITTESVEEFLHEETILCGITEQGTFVYKSF